MCVCRSAAMCIYFLNQCHVVPQYSHKALLKIHALKGYPFSIRQEAVLLSPLNFVHCCSDVEEDAAAELLQCQTSYGRSYFVSRLELNKQIIDDKINTNFLFFNFQFLNKKRQMARSYIPNRGSNTAILWTEEAIAQVFGLSGVCVSACDVYLKYKCARH